MSFPFPNVSQRCLLCGEAGCARWKGYFVRQVLCGDVGYAGPVAIHVGHCRQSKRDFSYVPDFLIPGRRLSRLSLKRFTENFAQTLSLKSSIDDLVGRVPLEDFTVALSTAYEWIYQTVRALRLNASALAIGVDQFTSVGAFVATQPGARRDVFFAKFGWHPAHYILCYPP